MSQTDTALFSLPMMRYRRVFTVLSGSFRVSAISRKLRSSKYFRIISVQMCIRDRIKEYWRNIASVEDYFSTNMDFLKPEIRDYFFKQYPDVYSKVDDLPPAKYNVGAKVSNSLISSGCIVNGTVEDSVIFKKSFVGNNCYIRCV